MILMRSPIRLEERIRTLSGPSPDLSPARPARPSSPDGSAAIGTSKPCIRDVTYREDHSQIRTGNGPQVMATIRLAIAKLARAASIVATTPSLRQICHQAPDYPRAHLGMTKRTLRHYAEALQIRVAPIRICGSCHRVLWTTLMTSGNSCGLATWRPSRPFPAIGEGGEHPG